MPTVQFIERRFWLILVIAVIFGTFLPQLGGALLPYLRYMVMAMLFLVFLKTDVVEIVKGLKNYKLMAYVASAYLVVIPLVLYWLIEPFSPVVALGSLILTAIPPGTSAPTLTDLIKGDVALAAAITIITSLLAPFTVPLVLAVSMGETVRIDRLGLFTTLALTIFVPLVLSQLLVKLHKTTAQRLKPFSSAVNVFILFFIIYVPIASQHELLLANLSGLWAQTAAVFALFTVLHLIGYFMAPRLAIPAKLALVTTRAYMNLGLGVVIAASFFSPEIMVFVILAEFAWGILLGPFKILAGRLVTAPVSGI